MSFLHGSSFCFVIKYLFLYAKCEIQLLCLSKSVAELKFKWVSACKSEPFLPFHPSFFPFEQVRCDDFENLSTHKVLASRNWHICCLLVLVLVSCTVRSLLLLISASSWFLADLSYHWRRTLGVYDTSTLGCSVSDCSCRSYINIHF